MLYSEGYKEEQAERAKFVEKDGNTPKFKERNQQKKEEDGNSNFIIDDYIEENNYESLAAQKQKTVFKTPSK